MEEIYERELLMAAQLEEEEEARREFHIYLYVCREDCVKRSHLLIATYMYVGKI